MAAPSRSWRLESIIALAQRPAQGRRPVRKRRVGIRGQKPPYLMSAFAAALLLDGRDELACDYVGHMPAAKDWGRLRMYRLRRRRQGP